MGVPLYPIWCMSDNSKSECYLVFVHSVVDGALQPLSGMMLMSV
jgi:hypothetical protein